MWGFMKKLLLLVILLYLPINSQFKDPVNSLIKGSGKIQISSQFVEEANQLTDYSLSQNYPNPFNPSTKIKFSIRQKGSVSLKVFNVIGKEVFTKYEKELNPGIYEYTFDMTNMPSGVYLYKLSADNFISIKKMVLIK